MKESSRFPLRRSLWNSGVVGHHKCRLHSDISASTTSQYSSSSSLPSRVARKRLDIAIVGPPNAGKSQLVNVLTKSPIAAVSRKRHTTRSDLLGARTIGNTQIVFKDTPGFLRIEDAKEERLDRDLIATAASEMQSVDFTLLVLDSARTLSESYRHALLQLMIGALNSQGRIEESFEDDGSDGNSDEVEKNNNTTDGKCKFAIVLNKVDLIKPKSDLIDLAKDVGSMADLCLEDQFQKHGKILDFEAQLAHSPIVFYVSALKEIGTEDIMDHLLNLATPCKEWTVEPGRATNMTTLEQVQEIIREKIYRSCHREVPHAVQQVNRIYRRIPNKGVVIHQDLVVFTKSHQKLVLGSSGRTLKRIEESARKDLRKMFGCDVALQLHVKFSKSKQRRGDSGGEYNLGEVSQSVL